MQLAYLKIKNFRSVGSIDITLRDMSVLIGPNNSGKTNITQALDLLLRKDKATFDKEADFRLVQGVSQTPCIIGALASGIKPEEAATLPSELNKFAANGYMYFEKTFELEDIAKPPKSTFTVYPNAEANKDDAIELKKTDLRKQFIDWLPDFHYIPPDENLANAQRMIKGLVGVILAESGLDKIKSNYEKLFSSPDLVKVMDGLQGEFSEFLSKMWTGIGIKFRAVGQEFRSLMSESISYDIEENNDKIGMNMVGNGLQRSLMIAAFSVYARHIQKQQQDDEKNKVLHSKQFFAIEEPELYLHPQMQRRLYEVLQSVSASDQILMCTHSQNLVRLEDYKSIYLVRKNSSGTYVHFWKRTDEMPNARETFLYITKVRPANEMFFANKVILVEGEAELVTIPVLMDKMYDHKFSLDEKGITIVNCQGKTNIPLFQQVLNTFRIPYLATYDKDTKSEQNKDLNEQIRSLAEKEDVGKHFVLNPDFDAVLGVSKSKINSLGKPQACYEYLNSLKKEDVPAKLSDLASQILQQSTSL